MGAENLVLWDKVRKVEDDYKEKDNRWKIKWQNFN